MWNNFLLQVENKVVLFQQGMIYGMFLNINFLFCFITEPEGLSASSYLVPEGISRCVFLAQDFSNKYGKGGINGCDILL